MGIEFILLGIALLCVGITGGSYKKLFTTKFNHVWALAVVLVGNIIVIADPLPRRLNNSLGLVILLATYVFLFGFCVANLNKKAMWMVMAGVLSNAIVIGLNQGMPVTKSGGYIVKETIKHQSAKSTDLLPWLTDIIPINFLSIAISVGDIVFGLGLILVCFFASRKEKPTVDIEEAEEVSEDLNEPVAEAMEIEPEQEPEPTSVQAPKAPVSSPMKMVKPEAKSISRGPLHKHKNKKQRWQEHHGFAALPSKEELGFNEETMDIVEGA
ncbi:MAG: DUF5317 family protein [Acidimicrobiia bacterium]